MTQIKIMSREAMQEAIEKGLVRDAAVISFYDPESSKNPYRQEPMDYEGVCDTVFMVGIPDIDIEILAEYGYTIDTYFSEADELAEFIIKAHEDGKDIICQCEYGQSRSAACAAAIREYFYRDGISVFADYRYYPNQLVFNILLKALRAKNSISEKEEAQP